MTPRLSVKGKEWTVIDREETDLMQHLLSVRSVTDHTRFFSPRFDQHLHDGGQLLGIGEAVRLLVTAVNERLPVGIFADYDVDGTTGAALVYELLRYLGVPVLIYIPTRTEGYGLSRRGVDALVSAGARLILTIDLGSTAGALMEEMRRAGLALPFIITDHHAVNPDQIPTDAVVVNPNQPDCPYPFKQLCGAAVVWKVMEQLFIALVSEKSHRISVQTADGLLKWSLDLVALATVCDLVPLIDENRVIVHFGLKVFEKQRRLGLKALAATAGINLREVTTTTLGFQIGPRLNVWVRMNQPAFESSELGPQVTAPLVLLVGRDRPTLTQISETLEGLNQERRKITQSVFEEAVVIVKRDGLDQRSALVVMAPNWPAGMVGLAAGKLVERFTRPAVVLTESAPGILVGSIRSIPGFPIQEVLHLLGPQLLAGGGHAMAGGVTLTSANQVAFTEGFERLADQMIDPADFIPRLPIEADIDLDRFDSVIMDQIDQFAPFGMANPRPTFLVRGVKLDDVRLIGATRTHLKARIDQKKSPLRIWDVIGFGLAPFADLCRAPVDLACQLSWNDWRGTRKPQLEIADLRLSL